MSGRIDAERILDAFLAPESDRLPDRVIDATLADIARTPQRRAMRVPWRFPLMTNTMRAAAGVAIVGVGVLAFNLRPTGNGATGTPAPTQTAGPKPTAASTQGAASTPSVGPWPAQPGIAVWTTYTSQVYGSTFGYPEDWNLEASATRAWQVGDPLLNFGPFTDIFTSPDGDVAVWVFRLTAEPGADVSSREGLGALVCELEASACEPISDLAEPMCAGRAACLPAVLVALPEEREGVFAYFADIETRQVTVVSIGREDSFPGSAEYGGSVQLLKSILTTMDVHTPEPGQVPG
jgi:hypothetical protein